MHISGIIGFAERMIATTNPEFIMTKKIKVRRLSETIGAEVDDINLSQLNPSESNQLLEALKVHHVLFFRKQNLNSATLWKLASKLGRPTEYPFLKGTSVFPEIVELIKRPEDTENFGGVWHSDTSYLRTPSMGALLYAIETPEIGGDTIFTNMHEVLDSLSLGMQKMLSELYAINVSDKKGLTKIRPSSGASAFSASHPAVRTHPETGRKLLYVNRAHTVSFENMTVAESKPLLHFLFERTEDPRFSYRFKWSPGCLAFWDNRACQHFPFNDYQGSQRRMLRVSLEGCKPF
ncbi:MAG: taurine dioxygenase [Gammaproteobacteria bacterium]|nr:taurine dioxygenase [Gammaproteobacteria bacterium]